MKTTLLRTAFVAALGFSFGFALPVAGALAQTAAPAASAIVSDSHLAQARAVLAASGISKSFDAVIPNVLNQLNVTLLRTRPELAADMKAVVDQLRPGFMKMTEEMQVNGARILASIMSEDELKQTNTFFTSAAGKKYVESQPVLLDRLVPAMQGWTEKVSQQMIDQIRAEMKKRGKDL